MSLSRALQVIEFIGRRSVPTSAHAHAPSASFADPDAEEFSPNHMTSLAMSPLFGPGVQAMPREIRAMIDWAEQEKIKRGMN